MGERVEPTKKHDLNEVGCNEKVATLFSPRFFYPLEGCLAGMVEDEMQL
jgi:hypothetical protein